MRELFRDWVLLLAAPLPNQRDITFRVPGTKSLAHHHYGYRLRVGDYRVLFNVFEIIEAVSIEEAKKRDERTY